jgi:hypothetical protein
MVWQPLLVADSGTAVLYMSAFASLCERQPTIVLVAFICRLCHPVLPLQTAMWQPTSNPAFTTYKYCIQMHPVLILQCVCKMSWQCRRSVGRLSEPKLPTAIQSNCGLRGYGCTASEDSKDSMSLDKVSGTYR